MSYAAHADYLDGIPDALWSGGFTGVHRHAIAGLLGKEERLTMEQHRIMFLVPGQIKRNDSIAEEPQTGPSNFQRFFWRQVSHGAQDNAAGQAKSPAPGFPASGHGGDNFGTGEP